MKVRTRTIVPIHPISGRLARESSYLTASQLLLSFARLLFCHCHRAVHPHRHTRSIWKCIFNETTVIYPNGIRQPIAVSNISICICLIDIRSKSKEQLNERRAGLSKRDSILQYPITKRGGSLSSETRSNRWEKGDGRLWGREAVKLGATLTPRRRLLSLTSSALCSC